MPGITIHLAAANCYLKTHVAEHVDEFIRGAISPDFAEDTDVSHRSAPNKRNNALSFLLGKVILKDCLTDFDINTSFGRGYFFHLITDYEFYRMLAKNEDLFREMTYREIKERLYHDYIATNDILKAKYDVVFPSIVKEYDIPSKDAPTLINIEDTCKMIEWLGELDLNAYLENMV